MAQIEFTKGIIEESIPDVKMTRSRDGSNGTATFRFEESPILESGNTQAVTGMYLTDEEGELNTREVKCKFVNGEPVAIEAIYIIKSVEEWERFMRFMERYAEEHGLGFSKS
ncbi:photosystem II 13kDa protein PsbW [Cyanobacterium sp. HL-69]|uniref:photosystem II reaction center protein Psb28 n=1 Tax=unclassified Cyanobacterium TaxID=2629879 RepID=UPI000852600F|nr:photosystem II reaction center protein Psb28 [Cyanobacterium sp. IPPAS B-1200]AUC62130.1 photosystem II 13kDa protein PsbW [Cyanobacterium sp. HL-69]OEJ79486.1 photosystem II reaction center protein Psb28 [Cyanobacterium sp. IPPAS B-1200]